jgi:hypothetical protein
MECPEKGMVMTHRRPKSQHILDVQFISESANSAL